MNMSPLERLQQLPSYDQLLQFVAEAEQAQGEALQNVLGVHMLSNVMAASGHQTPATPTNSLDHLECYSLALFQALHLQADTAERKEQIRQFARTGSQKEALRRAEEIYAKAKLRISREPIYAILEKHGMLEDVAGNWQILIFMLEENKAWYIQPPQPPTGHNRHLN